MPASIAGQPTTAQRIRATFVNSRAALIIALETVVGHVRANWDTVSMALRGYPSDARRSSLNRRHLLVKRWIVPRRSRLPCRTIASNCAPSCWSEAFLYDHCVRQCVVLLFILSIFLYGRAQQPQPTNFVRLVDTKRHNITRHDNPSSLNLLGLLCAKDMGYICT